MNGGGKSGYNFSVSAVPETTALKSASIEAAGFLRLPPRGGVVFASGAGSARLAAPRQAGFWELRQTHSALWHEVKDGEPRAGTEGDALLASTPETILAIKTADCLPLLLHAPAAGARPGWIAAVHAGWRGLAQDLPALVVKELLGRGVSIENLRVTLGPAICGPCYEIGPEVAAQFADFPPGDYLTNGRADRLHFSQHEFARARLAALGIPTENIWRSDLCTRHDALPSFRRDGQDCGRLYSCIWQ